MKNGDYCNREVVICEKTVTVDNIACLMKKFHAGDVVIVEKKGEKIIPVGIVTDRDIVLKVLAEKISPELVLAADIMSMDIYTIHEDSSIWDTFEMMRNRGVRRIPVVNTENELLGILTADDILEIIAEEISSLSKTVKEEQLQERRKIG